MHILRSAYRKLPSFLRYLLMLFLIGWVFFMIQRMVQLLIHHDQVTLDNARLLWYCLFNRGLLFDSVTLTYLLILPAFLLTLGFVLGCTCRWLWRISAFFYSLLFPLALAISLADIPYFSYYNARINRMVLAWTDKPSLMFKALFENIYYLPFLLVFFAVLFFLIRWIWRTQRKFRLRAEAEKRYSWYHRLWITILLLFVSFLGLRGDIDPAGMPIQVKHAFETNSPFINQMAINPVFNFLHTFTDFDIGYLPDEEVLMEARKYLGVAGESANPIAREVRFPDAPRHMNVVLVIMESLWAGQMQRMGNTGHLTPVLDSLGDQGIFYENIYTAGIHTYNGVFSTFYGLPALMQNKPTLSTEASGIHYSGLPTELKKNGYQTIFFVTGAKEFDNFSGVFPQNGIDRMIDETYFPKEKRLNNWGVGDHILFEYSIPFLDSMAAKNTPFMATYMTVSTHSPYTVPTDIPFTPAAESPRDRSYQYADWAIGHFLRMVQQKPWFSNTLFVFIADHGQNFDPTYDLPLSYHHTPFILYAPGTIAPASYTKPGLQIDVFPTVMAQLRIPYTNRTLGVDLATTSRPFAFFSADYKLGVLDETYFLILDKSGRESLYAYREKSLQNMASDNKALTDSMKHYTFTMLQTTQYLIRHRLTSLP